MVEKLRFQDWLQKKAEESGSPDVVRRRDEWVTALKRLHDQIVAWLNESDPRGLLAVERFEVARTDPILGTYDAPAIRIRVGDESVDVLPMGRDAFSTYVFRDSGVGAGAGGGRVDITNGVRKYILYREVRADGDTWHVLDDREPLAILDRERLEDIIQDLLS